jgi:acetyl-CoA C-acetyltransferase
MQKVFLLDTLRVPTGKKNGIYKTILPERLLATILTELLSRYSFLKQKTDEIIISNSVSTGGNMARFSTLLTDFPVEMVATTLDMQCIGGYQAVALASAKIKSGLANCIIVGGFESASLAPFRSYHPDDERFNGEVSYQNASFAPPSFGNSSLLLAAENVAKKYNISKNEMLHSAVESFQRAERFSETEKYKKNIVKINKIKKDATLRSNVTLQNFEKLTTENLIDSTTSAHLHDGAAAMVLVSESFLREIEQVSSVEFLANAFSGCLPNFAPEAFLFATKKLLSLAKTPISAISLFEVNESFALKPLLFQQEFDVLPQNVNIFGGNLAFGHPFGASPFINIMNLVSGLKHKKAELGLVTAAAAGGLGAALLIKQHHVD